jgi:transposase
MSYKSKIKVTEDIEFLRTKFKNTRDSKARQKIRSLIILKETPDKKQADLAFDLCVGHATLKRWYKNYRENGFNKFIETIPTGVKKSVIPQEVHNALEQKLKNSTDPLQGYWHAVEWVKDNFGISIKYQTLRNYMKTHFKSKLKSPRKSHYQKDEQAVKAFFKTARYLQAN